MSTGPVADATPGMLGAGPGCLPLTALITRVDHRPDGDVPLRLRLMAHRLARVLVAAGE